MPKGDGGETIQVHLRLRPTKKPSGFIKQDDSDETIVRLKIPERGVSRESGYVNNSKTSYNFKFNSVLDMPVKQGAVFDRVGREAVTSVLDGVNSTIFAYGQTGSGKTFTITGGVDSYEQRGLIPRAISMIFQEFDNRSDYQFTCHISYLEIYNEAGFDLLDPSHETKALEDLPRVTMMEDELGITHMKNLSMHRASSEEEALNLLFLGDTNRAIAETPMNMASSRSHCLFTLFVEGRKHGSDTVRHAKLHMVDLAGSERAHKTGATGQTLREATYINTSLFYLEMCIVALHEKATKQADRHVPYRNSMMTSVLRDSLGGNCKTIMVATVSAEMDQTEETISTMKFAQRVALIKNSAIVNEDLDPTLMIARLKGEVASLKGEVAFLKNETGEGDALDKDEVEALHQAIERYVGDMDPYASLQMGPMTLIKLKDAFAIFKNLVLEARMEAKKGGKGSEGVAGEGAGEGDSEASATELVSLREKVRQRDQEIAILVNMVKQAKAGRPFTAEPVDQERGNASSGAIWGGGSMMPPSQAKALATGRVEGGVQQYSGGGGGGGGEANAGAEPKWPPSRGMERGDTPKSQQSDRRSTAGSSTRGGKPRKSAPLVHGVPLTADVAMLDDAEKAFEHFRSKWPRLASIEENKTVLKEKYDLAKQLYEQVTSSRSTIGYLKKTIEQIRRENAMYRHGLLENDAEDREPEQQDEEEKQHMQAIDREKAAYAKACSELRDAKTAIEHIQKLMESARSKLQVEFDEWYGKCLHAEARHKVRLEQQQQQQQPQQQQQQQQRLPQDKPQQPPPQQQQQQGGAAESGGSRREPPRMQLTGNKEADDDIIAFQKAREELYALQRLQQQRQASGGSSGGAESGGGSALDRGAQAKH